jgi:hypothetical protein
MPPLERRIRRSWLLCAVAVAVLGLGGCSESDDEASIPFTYDYPEEFEQVDDVPAQTSLGSPPLASTGLMLDDQDGVVLQSYALNVPITDENVAMAKRELDQLVSQVDRKASGDVGTVAGLPAISYEDIGITTVPDGVSRLTFIFDGDREYLINCQASAHPAEVEAACDQVLSTLQPA